MQQTNCYPPGSGMGNMKLAHAYIPYQRYSDHYPLVEAFKKGTLYPELWMPYRQGPRGY